MKQRFFDLAKKIRVHSDHYQHQLGCVIVKKNRIVSVGFNKLKTHPKSTHKYNSLHAEVDALIKAIPEDCKGAEAYVYREKRTGQLGNARPCASCYSALQAAGIKVIYYSSEEGYKNEKIK
jgi:deoxycytidylate deaminase